MADLKPYSSPNGVEAAIKGAACAAAKADPSLTINERIRMEYFRRFLSRVFSKGFDSEWILKGHRERPVSQIGRVKRAATPAWGTP